MAKCNYCGNTILFGGEKQGDLRFCNDTCHQNGYPLHVAEQQIPPEIIEQQILQVHQGPCPKCHKQRGPVDVHNYYTVWSIVFMTSWKSHTQISCRTCGVISQIRSLFSSLLLGWWGLPWGVVYTPIQITRNFIGLVNPPKKAQPSKKLAQQVKTILGRNLLE